MLVIHFIYAWSIDAAFLGVGDWEGEGVYVCTGEENKEWLGG